MTLTKALLAILNEELRILGFRKTGSTWRLNQDETVIVVNLQKSQYDNAYFINIGFCLQSLPHNDNPKCEECHVYMRLEDLPAASTIDLSNLLLFGDSPTISDEKGIQIRKAFRDIVIPAILEASTIIGLKALAHRNCRIAVSRIAKPALGLNEIQK